jgi:hypothetical protein
MNIFKGITALLIFIIIFAGAWALDHNLKREHRTIRFIEQLVENPHINNLDQIIPDNGEHPNPNELIMKSVPHHDPFNPREYIRIRRKPVVTEE